MPSFVDRVRNSWSVFTGKTDVFQAPEGVGPASSSRPDRVRMRAASRRTIIPAITNRIAVDVAQVNLFHSIVDQNGMPVARVQDWMNDLLRFQGNIDQTSRDFMQDVVTTMLDEGHVAIVPTEMDSNPRKGTINKIYSWRTAKVVTWYPKSVTVNVYNEDLGRRVDITLPKSQVAIIQNPFYAIMNEPNSTLQRLLKKISLIDYADEKSVSSKLDLIVQLPYTVKGEKREKEAEERKAKIEQQLNESKYGIAYMDSTEKITQLNRSLENNLDSQIKDLTNTLYGQLGLTEDLMKGTASENEQINYYNRTIEPILSAIVDELVRKFFTLTAITQGHSISFFRDPFKLAGANQVSDLADKLTRNAILSSNEVRVRIGLLPSPDARADALSNKNINESPDALPPPMTDGSIPEDQYNYNDAGYQYQ